MQYNVALFESESQKMCKYDTCANRRNFKRLNIYNPLLLETTKMGILTNSKYPDEMQHNAAFHLCLHCLRRLI